MVSSANAQAVEEEWSKYELKPYCKALLSQEAGSKAECIQKLSALGYPPEQILMVGDAMGDYEAAKKNGVWFYPIVVNNEKESWQQLQEEAYPKLLHGTFDREYQKELLDKFERGFQKTL